MTETVWYGELRATRGNTIVIRDTSLPEASKGRIYLYNTERQAIVEYDETIVSPKLFPLAEDQVAEVEKRFKSSWEAARKELLGRSTKKTPEETATPKKSLAEDLLPDEDDDLLDDDDDE